MNKISTLYRTAQRQQICCKWTGLVWCPLIVWWNPLSVTFFVWYIPLPGPFFWHSLMYSSVWCNFLVHSSVWCLFIWVIPFLVHSSVWYPFWCTPLSGAFLTVAFCVLCIFFFACLVIGNVYWHCLDLYFLVYCFMWCQYPSPWLWGFELTWFRSCVSFWYP